LNCAPDRGQRGEAGGIFALTRLVSLFRRSKLLPAPQIVVALIKLFGQLEADNPNILRDPLHVPTKPIEHTHMIVDPNGQKELLNLVVVERQLRELLA
jgi:hypothetical protein